MLIDLILKWNNKIYNKFGLASLTGHGSLFGVGRANNANNVGNANNVNGVAGQTATKILSNPKQYKINERLNPADIHILKRQNITYNKKTNSPKPKFVKAAYGFFTYYGSLGLASREYNGLFLKTNLKAVGNEFFKLTKFNDDI